MSATAPRGLRRSQHQLDADQVAEAFARIAAAAERLRVTSALSDWLPPCLHDAADDARGLVDRRADDDGEAFDWRALDAALVRLDERPTDNVVQLRLL